MADARSRSESKASCRSTVRKARRRVNRRRSAYRCLIAQIRLLGTHVERRPNHLREVSKERFVRERLCRRLGDAEVDDFRHGTCIVLRDEQIRRLEIAMNDSLLMRMLHRVAHVDKQRESFARNPRERSRQ